MRHHHIDVTMRFLNNNDFTRKNILKDTILHTKKYNRLEHTTQWIQHKIIGSHGFLNLRTHPAANLDESLGGVPLKCTSLPFAIRHLNFIRKFLPQWNTEYDRLCSENTNHRDGADVNLAVQKASVTFYLIFADECHDNIYVPWGKIYVDKC